MGEEKMYVIVNDCYGGFRFSKEFEEELSKNIYNGDDDRDNQIACNLLLEKGSKWASYSYSKLILYSIPIEMKDYYHISEYDGTESICLTKDDTILKLLYELLENPSQELADSIKLKISRIKSYNIVEVVIPE